MKYVYRHYFIHLTLSEDSSGRQTTSEPHAQRERDRSLHKEMLFVNLCV